jgi:hypothetical protein
MQKPEESLDDFTGKAAEKVVGPPATVLLRSRGGVKVLKPLAHREALVRAASAAGNPRNYRLSWFQSALASAGALAIMALVLGSAIIIGIYDPPSEPEVASVESPDNLPEDAIVSGPQGGPSRSEEPSIAQIHTAQNMPLMDNEVHPARRTAKPMSARHLQLAAHTSRRRTRRPQPAMTRFVPTTLVITAENGEIKTRIEPQLAALYKKPLTITN